MRYNQRGYQRQAREYAETHDKGKETGDHWKLLREENARRAAQAGQ